MPSNDLLAFLKTILNTARVAEGLPHARRGPIEQACADAIMRTLRQMPLDQRREGVRLVIREAEAARQRTRIRVDPEGSITRLREDLPD